MAGLLLLLLRLPPSPWTSARCRGNNNSSSGSIIAPLVVIVCLSVLLLATTTGVDALPRGLRKDLYCGVCLAVVDEVEAEIANTKESHTVQVRFRVDEKKRIPYARTEFRIIEIIENEISKKFDQFAISGPADNLRIVRLSGGKDIKLENVSMGAEATNSIRRLFDHMTEEYLEDMTRLFHNSAPNIKRELCVTITRACTENQILLEEAQRVLTETSAQATTAPKQEL